MTYEHHAAAHARDRERFLRSGEVATAARVNLQTLRYYERRGLLARPERSASGHRRYPPHTVTLLQMIKNAQRLGLSLDEIAELIGNDPSSNSLSAIAERKLVEVDAKIAELVRVRETLARYVRSPRSGR